MAKNEVATQKRELTISERFTARVITEFQDDVGEVALSDFQKRLAQNYFMGIDDALKKAEIGRKRKSENYRDEVPVTWENVSLNQIARDVVTYARLGLDPAQKNHIHVIPFKNNNTKKYDITFMEGYRGIELKAEKYGLDVPDAVIVELVYSTDTFTPFKKDRRHAVEDYEFEVTNPFDRGDIIGGFYYHVYNNNPSKNKLVIMTIEDIEKRKPQYAGVEFWGGEKDIWKDGKRTGKKEQVDGWYPEMCYKTVYRAAYNDITIDSQKIDDNYMRLKQLETQAIETRANAEIAENANTEIIDLEPEEVEEPEFVDVEIIEDDEAEEPESVPVVEAEQVAFDEGPDY